MSFQWFESTHTIASARRAIPLQPAFRLAFMAASAFEHAKAKRINLAPRATPRAPARPSGKTLG